MGKLIERIFGGKLATWTRGLPVSNSRTAGFFFRRESASGRDVTAQDAMSLSAVFAAVRLISQVIGMLPLAVYQAKPDGGKKHALSNPAYKLLRNTPNEWMTAKNFRQTLEVHRLLFGNAYAEITWNYAGSAAELWPIEPWRVKPEVKDDRLRYSIDNGARYIAAEDMLHIPLISFDGITGQSFIDFAIDSLGLNLSAQDFAGAFFANGATTSGILYHEGATVPKEEQRKEIRKGWEERHTGNAGKGYRTGVLWGGWKYQNDGGAVDPVKSQLLEQRQFGVSEVARWLNVPSTLLRDLSRATWSNMEDEQIAAVVYSWMPIAIDYEQEYDRKLLNPPTTYSKHNFAGLLRGNSKDRSQFYKELFAVGGFSVNRILELEDEDPIGPLGDLRFVPANMMTLEEAARKAKEPSAAPAPSPDPSPTPAPEPDPVDPMDDVPNDVGTLWMKDTLERLLGKEINQLLRAAAQPAKFLSWIDSFYGDHQELLAQALAPAAVALGLPMKAPALARAWVEGSRQELLELAGNVKPGQLAEAVQQLTVRWKQTRAAATLARLKE